MPPSGTGGGSLQRFYVPWSFQEYGLFFASFDLFTAKGGQSQNLNVIS